MDQHYSDLIYLVGCGVNGLVPSAERIGEMAAGRRGLYMGRFAPPQGF